MRIVVTGAAGQLGVELDALSGGTWAKCLGLDLPGLDLTAAYAAAPSWRSGPTGSSTRPRTRSGRLRAGPRLGQGRERHRDATGGGRLPGVGCGARLPQHGLRLRRDEGTPYTEADRPPRSMRTAARSWTGEGHVRTPRCPVGVCGRPGSTGCTAKTS